MSTSCAPSRRCTGCVNRAHSSPTRCAPGSATTPSRATFSRQSNDSGRGRQARSKFEIGRDLFGLYVIDGEAGIKPFADLLGAAVVIDPGVEKTAPATFPFDAHADAGRQL